MRATKIEAISDDRDPTNKGWYIRFRLEDGQEIDSPAFDSPRRDAGHRRLLRVVQQQAKWEGVELPTPVEFEVHN